MAWPPPKKGWYHIAFQKIWANHPSISLHTVLVTLLNKISFPHPKRWQPPPLCACGNIMGWAVLFLSPPDVSLNSPCYLWAVPPLSSFANSHSDPSPTHLASFGTLVMLSITFFLSRRFCWISQTLRGKNMVWKLKGRECGGRNIRAWGTRFWALWRRLYLWRHKLRLRKVVVQNSVSGGDGTWICICLVLVSMLFSLSPLSSFFFSFSFPLSLSLYSASKTVTVVLMATICCAKHRFKPFTCIN